MRRGLLALAALALALACGGPAWADPIDEYIAREMKSRRIPGVALAVVRDGAVVKQQGYGVANLEHDVPVTPDTVFELASLTKTSCRWRNSLSPSRRRRPSPG